MSNNRERWQEERENILERLFSALFGRSSASKEDIGRDIHRLGTVNRRLADDD